MRCPNCNKFVSYEDPHDVQVDALDIDQDAHIDCQVTVTLKCGECSNDLKQAAIEIQDDIAYEGDHTGEGHELQIEEKETCPEMKTQGKGRGTKTFYGVTVVVVMTCVCGKLTQDITLAEYEQASNFEEVC